MSEVLLLEDARDGLRLAVLEAFEEFQLRSVISCAVADGIAQSIAGGADAACPVLGLALPGHVNEVRAEACQKHSKPGVLTNCATEELLDECGLDRSLAKDTSIKAPAKKKIAKVKSYDSVESIPNAWPDRSSEPTPPDPNSEGHEPHELDVDGQGSTRVMEPVRTEASISLTHHVKHYKAKQLGQMETAMRHTRKSRKTLFDIMPSGDDLEDVMRGNRGSWFSKHDPTSSVATGRSQPGQENWFYHVHRLVTSARFDYVFGIILLCNAASIGVQVDYVARNVGGDLPSGFRVVEWIFCTSFVFELSLRLLVRGCSFFTMPGWGWNVFEFATVAMQLTEEFIALIVSDDAGTGINFNFLRVLRILRLLRVVRFFRVLHLVRELNILVTSVAGSLRTFMWAAVLLFLMIFITSVYLTQIVADHRTTEPTASAKEPGLKLYYGSLGSSLLSLFQATSGGHDWDDLVKPLQNSLSPLMALVFSLYVAFATLVMLNLVTGIFVDSAQESINDSKDMDLVNRVHELFLLTDVDQSGCITWSEFRGYLNQPQMVEYFKLLDLDPSEETARELWLLLDEKHEDEISSEDFIMGCLRLRGSARSIDMVTLMQDINAKFHWLHVTLHRMEDMIRGGPDEKNRPVSCSVAEVSGTMTSLTRH